jgi:DUF1680 family protein
MSQACCAPQIVQFAAKSTMTLAYMGGNDQPQVDVWLQDPVSLKFKQYSVYPPVMITYIPPALFFDFGSPSSGVIKIL